MAEVQGGASFNPEDASGLLDNARMKITALVVDFFTAASGSKFLNADVTFEGGGQKITEHYLIGGADQWAPNANKTGAIPVTEGGKIWNKSDIYKFVKSMIDAGFPKEKVGADLSVFVGSDVHVARITQEGATYVDKKGQTRNRTTLLVTKIYELPKGGAVAGAKGKVPVAKGATNAPATSAAAGADDANDAVLTEWLVDILSAKGSVTKEKLPTEIFMKATKAKRSADRAVLQERVLSDAFLGSLTEAGLITVDGNSIAIAG